MSLRDDRDVASVNPDCREGKHRACRGDAWSVSADKPIACVCSCHAPKPAPVTVGELLDALATYPREALVFTGESGSGTGTVEVEIDGVLLLVWAGVTSAGNWHDADGPEMRAAFANERPRARLP